MANFEIIYNFMIFLAAKMVGQKQIFPPSYVVLLLDPWSKIQDPG
jgi:hypothetical protein